MDAKTTSKKTKHAKTLSILVARDGLSFCVSTQRENVKTFFEEHFSSPQSPENLLKELQSFFTYSFEEKTSSVNAVEVFYANPLYALVPRPYFDENMLGDYLKFNAKLLPTDELTYDRLDAVNANLVYIPYTNINNYLFEKFGEFTFQHAMSRFVKQCKPQSKPKDVSVFINVFTTHFDLCIFKDTELLLCNSYDYFSPEDFVYYTLFAFEQLKLDTDTLDLKLCGELEKDSRIFELLYTYVRHVSWIEPRHDMKINVESLKQAAAHKHQFLLNTIACE